MQRAGGVVGVDERVGEQFADRRTRRCIQDTDRLEQARVRLAKLNR